MVLNIKTKFGFPYGKAIQVLITNSYDMNFISTSFVDEILQDRTEQLYCEYNGKRSWYSIQTREAN